MADNINVTPGTGKVVIADEVVDGTLGTGIVQYVKLMDGTLDSTTKISPATSAKQPALGTAGTPSADVITVQGNASGTPQPVSGTFWQATQPISAAALPLPTGAALDATLTGGTQQSKITNGTTVADTVANDTGYNGQVINNGMKVIAFSTSAAGAQTLLANTDIRGYSSISIQFTSVGVGLVFTIPFASASGGTYASTNTWTPTTSVSNSTSAPSSTVNIFQISRVVGPFFQIAISALTSGTVSGSIILSPTPLFPNTIGVSALLATATPLADAIATTQGSVQPQMFNGTTFDRTRGALAGIVLASAARTTTVSTDLTNFNWRGVRVVLSVTVASGTGGLSVQIRGKDSISASYYLINAAPTVVTATGTYVYDVYPTATTAANGITQVTNSTIPRTFNVNMAVGDASSYTYSVSYEGIL